MFPAGWRAAAPGWVDKTLHGGMTCFQHTTCTSPPWLHGHGTLANFQQLSSHPLVPLLRPWGSLCAFGSFS